MEVHGHNDRLLHFRRTGGRVASECFFEGKGAQGVVSDRTRRGLPVPESTFLVERSVRIFAIKTAKVTGGAFNYFRGQCVLAHVDVLGDW